MSDVTTEQSETLTKIWKIHNNKRNDKRTVEALSFATDELKKLRELPNDLPPENDYERELAIMAMVLAKTLAKRAKNAKEWQEYIHQSLTEAVRSFPLSSSFSEALQKGQMWETVYGDTSAQQEIARYLFDLTQLLSIIANDSELSAFSVGFAKILENSFFALVSENRANLIHQVETAHLSTAFAAYLEFLKQYGPRSKKNQSTEALVISLKLLWRFANVYPVLKEKLESVLTPLFLRLSVRKMFEGETLKPDLLDSINKFKALRFMGMGNNQVATLPSGEVTTE